MIRERGLTFSQLEPGSFDMPYGFKTGAGVIFGSSGGVSEAVLRYAAEKLSKGKGIQTGFVEVSSGGVRTLNVRMGDKDLRLAVVSGLGSARKLIDKIRKGEEYYDLVEVMACCGGCVNGGGQPITEEKMAVESRSRELFDNDKMLQFHSAHENPYVRELYEDGLTPEKAHHLLHTEYSNRKSNQADEVSLSEGVGEKNLTVQNAVRKDPFWWLTGKRLNIALSNWQWRKSKKPSTEGRRNPCTLISIEKTKKIDKRTLSIR